MDKTDLQILKSMADKGTVAPKEISEETDIAKSTIYYRIDKLKEEGIIKNEIFDVDKNNLGLGITVISEVMAIFKEGYHQRVGSKLAEIEGVSQVYFVMGDTDFIVVSHFADQEDVEDLIVEFEKIEEVERTSSKYIISTIKDDGNLLSNYTFEKLSNSLGID